MKKIGIFGGSFDPVHLGHTRIAESALNELNLDKVIIIPAADPPHKKGKLSLDAHSRISMLHKAIEGKKGLEISTMEIKRGGVSYSYLTVEELRKVYPEDELYFIIGYDSLIDFKEWKNPDYIASECILAVAIRGNEPDDDLNKMSDDIRASYGADIKYLKCPWTNISSHKIRECFKNGNIDEIREYMDKNVIKMIEDNGYYKEQQKKTIFENNTSYYVNLEEKLKEKLDVQRYAHTLGVAYTATALAMRYEQSVDDAMLAGLLHDCAKCNSDNENIKLLEDRGLEITEAEYKNAQLVHAKAGAVLAKEEYGVDDENILAAIRTHTTGAPGMTMLQKIIYVADYIEPARTKPKHLDELRKIAFTDLDAAVALILKSTLEYLKKTKKPIDPTTQETFEYYDTIRFE